MAFVFIELDQAEFELLNQTWNGEGGFQRLLDRLKGGQQYAAGAGWGCSMSPEDAKLVLMYSSDNYGQGTFQRVLRALAPKVAAAIEADGGFQEELPLEP